MIGWDQWKKRFDVWEARTAEYLEAVMKSPAFLEPVGGLLTATMKAKAMGDKAGAEATEKALAALKVGG